MSTAEIIDRIKTLPLEERKLVLRFLREEIEEDSDTRLFDERIKEADGRTLTEILASLKPAP